MVQLATRVATSLLQRIKIHCVVSEVSVMKPRRAGVRSSQ